MKGRIFDSLVLKVYSVSGIVLFSSALFVLQSNCSFYEREYLDSRTNWILDFFNECNSNTESPLIVAGNLSDKIITKIHHSTKRTIALFTKPETSSDKAYASAVWTRDYYEKGLFPFQHKARIFLVAAKSQPVLRHLFKQLKSSRWWNSSGFFLILDEDPENSSCRNAGPYLSTAWLNGLLSTVYLCLKNDAKILVLFSYNPFDDKAPRPDWKTEAIYPTGRNGHIWTLFRREFDLGYLEGSRVSNFSRKVSCGGIFFDKTINLNGYPVRINVLEFPPTLVFQNGENISGLKKYSREDGWLAQTLWEWLNATIVVVPFTGRWGLGFTDENGFENGMKADVKDGRADMSLNYRYMRLTRNLHDVTYPHIRSDYCFLTKSRGVLPLWKTMNKFIHPTVGLPIFVIVIVVIPLLVNLEKSEYTGMIFNVIRMLVSAPLVKIPRRFSARFLVVGLLAVVVIANGTFQSQLAAVVAKPRTIKDIDTLDELEQSGYKIHGYVAFQIFIGKPELRRRYVISEVDEECFEMAIRDLPVACANGCMMLEAKSRGENELHVAEEPIFTDYHQYITGIDWPLLGRVNRLIQRMVSGGLPDYWRKRTLWEMALESVPVSTTPSSYPLHPIRLNDLDRTFYLLLGGLSFSTLIFAAELALFRWRNK